MKEGTASTTGTVMVSSDLPGVSGLLPVREKRDSNDKSQRVMPVVASCVQIPTCSALRFQSWPVPAPGPRGCILTSDSDVSRNHCPHPNLVNWLLQDAQEKQA